MKLKILCFMLLANVVSSATYDHVTQCTGTVALGESNPYDFTDNLDTDTGAVFMVEDTNFQVKCCGVLSYWEINARVATSIDLQVWRRTATSYELVGFNSITPNPIGNFIYNVPTSDRISVKYGDYIGWFSPTTEVISYNLAGTYPIMNRKRTGATSFARGDTLNWANEDVPVTNRQYAIGAQVVAGTTPTLNIGSNHAVTVDESTASGVTVVTLSVVDADSMDTHVVNLLRTDNAYFELDSANLVIKTLQADIPEGVYSMDLQVIDGCYLSSTSSVTLTVQNTGIAINNLPHTFTVREDVYQQEKLYDLDVTEATDGWYCDMEDTNTIPFSVRQVNASAGPEYAVFVNEWAQLDYDTKSNYILKIHCYDGSHTASGTATVTVVKNQDPSFTNLDNSVTINANTVVNSEVIFTVSVTDSENDQIIFNMSTSPAGGPFDILDSGKVVMTSNVLRHHASASYDLSITANDGYNSVGPRTLTVTINNINDKPTITNLPTDINVIENTALSTSLFTVTVDDLDSSDPRIFSATFNPPEAVKFFTVNSTSGVVYTSDTHNIDFDVMTDISIEMSIMVTDGKEKDEQILAIQIQNLNEAPSFSQTHYSISRDEGNSNLQFPLTRYNIRDPDNGDTHTYSIDCGSNTSRVSIDTSTGRISFSGEYDLDTSGTPTDFSCTLNVADYDGLSDSCEIAVHVRYVNEHTPLFPFTEYDLIVYYYEIIGVIKTTIAATDLDLTDHGTFYYSLTQTYDGGADLFGVLSNGSVYIKSDLTPYGATGATFDVLIIATDTGGRASTSTIHVTIPPFVNGTTEKPFEYLEDITNTSLLAAGVLASIIVVTLSLLMLHYYCRLPKCDCCKPKPPKPIPPEDMPLPKPIKLKGTGEERVTLDEKESSIASRNSNSQNENDSLIPSRSSNSKDERISEMTSAKPESRDINRWLKEVDSEGADAWNK